MLLAIVSVIVFWLVQASALLVFAVPFSWALVALWAASHFIRAIGLTMAFHRYFAHRSFQMNRAARFVWTFIATASMQKGPLWWAGHHVNHHRFSDHPGDPHSPVTGSFYHAHIGWFLGDTRTDRLEPSNPVIRDFSSAPELVWLNEFHFVPPALLAIAMYLAGGLPWLVWGFCLPTVTLAHSTFAINTINHMYGSRRFDTRDQSRNNPITAFLTTGEGWHNNHHRYQRSARQGFYWWEVDVTWYTILAMEAVGLAWDVQGVPKRIYDEARVRKAQLAARQAPSAAEPAALSFELAEEAD